MITIALANYMTQAGWQTCETTAPLTINSEYPFNEIDFNVPADGRSTPVYIGNNTKLTWDSTLPYPQVPTAELDCVKTPHNKDCYPEAPIQKYLYFGSGHLSEVDHRYLGLRQYEGCKNFDLVGLFTVIFISIMIC